MCSSTRGHTEIESNLQNKESVVFLEQNVFGSATVISTDTGAPDPGSVFNLLLEPSLRIAAFITLQE